MGNGTNPLLWLITLAFLGGDRGLLGGNNNGAGVIAGENSAKIDCLQQGQAQLAEQLRQQTSIAAFQGINDQLISLAGIQRDSTAAVTGQVSDLRAQLAECCCDLRAGQQATQTAIAMQTNELNNTANANTQRIVDLLCEQAKAVLQQDNDRLRQQLSEQTIIAALSKGKGNS